MAQQFATISLVQSIDLDNGASGASLAQSFPGPCAGGRMIGVKVVGSTSATAPTDDQGNTYIQAGAELSVGSQKISRWYTYNSKAGVVQVTAHWGSAGINRNIGITEWAGVDAKADPLDKISSDNNLGADGSNMISSDVTPSMNGELILCSNLNDALNPSPNSPFIDIVNENSPATLSDSEYIIQSVAAAIHADFNDSGGGASSWSTLIATFKPAEITAWQNTLRNPYYNHLLRM